MHLVAPDILQAGKGLSLFPCAIGILIAFCLWGWGWKAHRFWIVLFATLGAGIFGLSYGPTQGVQSLVAGLLMAIAAGALVLDIVRVVAFIAGAITVTLMAQQFAPAWREPFLFCFMGGFAALLLFRYWMMALFSFVGTLVSVHSVLLLLDRLKKIDAVELSLRRPGVLNTIVGISTVAGLMIQFYFDRRAQKKKSKGSSSEAVEKPKDSKKVKWKLGWGGKKESKAPKAA